MTNKPRSIAQDARDVARTEGRFSKMKPCPGCGKSRALEPGYTVSEGGLLPDDSPQAGDVVCRPCVQKQRKAAGLGPATFGLGSRRSTN